jgi:VanZ family protein
MFDPGKKRMSRRSLLALVWTLLILALCWTPRAHLPLRETGPSLLSRTHADKVVHAGIFGLFALLWRRASGPGSLAVIAISGVALAVITELGQETAFVGRDADIWDGLADTLGVGLGLLLAVRLERKRALPSPA